MLVAIGQQVADIMEANGQGWRIQSEYGYDTRMMFWRQRLIERLENSDQHQSSELLPMLAKRNLFFPLLITILLLSIVLLCKNCILGIYDEIKETRRRRQRAKKLRTNLQQMGKIIEFTTKAI